MLRRLHHLAAIAAVSVLVTAPAHATDFLTAIEDVPLVRGLTELPDPIVFEGDQGRVVRTSAEGNVDTAQITSFYTASLPALGWKPVTSASGLAFERENERLTIGLREPALSKPAQVRFELIVKLASTRLPE